MHGCVVMCNSVDGVHFVAHFSESQKVCVGTAEAKNCCEVRKGAPWLQTPVNETVMLANFANQVMCSLIPAHDMNPPSLRTWLSVLPHPSCSQSPLCLTCPNEALTWKPGMVAWGHHESLLYPLSSFIYTGTVMYNDVH